MKEEKKFKEKWNDSKYKAKVKLSGYGIFILIIIFLLLLSGGGNSTNNNTVNNNKENYQQITFNKPTINNYLYEIEINTQKENKEKEYYYHGKVYDDHEEIIKEIEEEKYNYQLKDDKYYILQNDIYILTTKHDVYKEFYSNILEIENINNYLKYAVKNNEEYIVYLKDIILDSTSNKYITFKIKENNISIDYTNLVNELNNENYDKYIVDIKYIL